MMTLLVLVEFPFASLSGWLLALILLVGLVGLAIGGDKLTEGAAAVSVRLKINPVIVGLTVVSMATSMPELVTSLLAAEESPGLAVGNILGSNIANIGLILGVTALIAPLAIQLRLIRREVPILIVVTMVFSLFAVGGFSRLEGIILLAATVGYLVYIARSAREVTEATKAEFVAEVRAVAGMRTARACGYVIGGSVLLALGADLLVGSSVELASRLGVSDVLIGLTIVAVGTSLPELAASVAAAKMGHSDICAGNIVGSNLFNLLLIGGSVATISPIPVDPGLLRVEFPAMLILTVLLLWFFKTGHAVCRREGLILLFLYGAILSLSAASQMGYLF